MVLGRGLEKERKDKNDVSRERMNERKKKRRKERKDHTITSANSYPCFVLLVHLT